MTDDDEEDGDDDDGDGDGEEERGRRGSVSLHLSACPARLCLFSLCPLSPGFFFKFSFGFVQLQQIKAKAKAKERIHPSASGRRRRHARSLHRGAIHSSRRYKGEKKQSPIPIDRIASIAHRETERPNPIPLLPLRPLNSSASLIHACG
jgi:hypothetical protein